jgi:hypothetical protein
MNDSLDLGEQLDLGNLLCREGKPPNHAAWALIELATPTGMVRVFLWRTLLRCTRVSTSGCQHVQILE